MNARRVHALQAALAMLLAALPAACGLADETAPTLKLHQSPDAITTFDVDGLSEAELAAFAALSPAKQATVFQVFVESTLEQPPPVGGRVQVIDKTLRFTPRYPLEPDASYRAVFHRGHLTGKETAPLTGNFGAARLRPVSTTEVAHIYPSADRLPENQLKFYVHFSAPMSRGEAYRHIHLIDETTGKEVEGAFLELGEELWDAEFRRFTLLCDPGRVKRGLKPREELGPVLEEGHSYTLVVDDAWRDARRAPLKRGARKRFSVGPPDDETVDPKRWKLEPPAAGSTDPLVVRFGEPLDHSMLLRVLSIVYADGRNVAGEISTSDNETRWQFTPERPWTAGAYQLVAATTLEDLASNSIGRPFEVDAFERVQRRIETKTVSVPFAVR